MRTGGPDLGDHGRVDLSLADLDWPRPTARLLIRPVREDDVDAVHGYRRRRDVAWWLGGAPESREDFASWFLRPGRVSRTLVLEQDGHVIGDLMLRVGDGWAQVDVAAEAVGVEAELGWVLDPAYGGKGLATEAVVALLEVAFAPAPAGLGLRRVTAGCFAANERSWRLMERVGMRHEQRGVRDSLHAELGWLDGLTYALLAEEWRVRRGRAG